MEAGAAHRLPRAPSRPTFNRPPFSRPPFPSNSAVRPVQMNGPLSPPGPSSQDYRPPAQAYRPALEHWRAQEQRQGAEPRPPHARDSWQRRRRNRNGPFTPPPHEPRDDKLFARMVEVIGFPGYTRPQDLIHTFIDYGPAKVDRMYSGTATLVFSDSEEAAAAIRASSTVCLYGEFLTIRPYTKASEHTRNPKNYRRGAEKNKQKGPTVDPTTLSWEGDFQQQLDALLKAVRLSHQEIHQLTALYHDLDSVMKGIWPGCRTIPFGSVTTGLGVKASDADCFVLLPAARGQAVPLARRALSQYPRLFTSLVAIPNANTPIVKFYHLPTKTHCDVSFKTLLGVQNSKLIGFLLHADPRLLPVAVVIKYWASVHELSGTGKLTNYALIMMLIYYLQSQHELLPSVAWLQRDPATDYIVDGWNTGFMSDHDRLPRTTDASSVADLIGGFFSYYTRLDLANFVVCPYLGFSIRKIHFKNMNDLPMGFERYQSNVSSGAALPLRVGTPICVQDPFEQCHNVASSVTTRLAAELDLYFKFAADAYEQEKAGGCKNFLKKILVERPVLPRAKGKGKVEFRAGVRSYTLNNICREDWRKPCEDVINTIFNDLLQANLEPEQKAAEATEAPDSPEKKRKRVKYTGVLTRAVWKRKKLSRLFGAMQLKFYDQEKRITNEIIATDSNEYNVPFQLVATFANPPRYVSLVIRPRGGNLQAFKEFGRFFQDNITHWFSVLVKPYCDKISMSAIELPTTDDERNNTQESDEESESQSDASTEDERKPVVQDMYTIQYIFGPENEKQSDSEKSPSDTDKENIEEAVNVDSNTAAEDTHKTDTGSGRSRRRRKRNKNNSVNKDTPQPVASGGKDN
ncbi:uncharacterized protein [Choristoneura fumiferana]|uniref:uncharacterized protein n=1 Tax=Choristoneura fumiferana TaxID=7141 RepID=UPI003D15B700